MKHQGEITVWERERERDSVRNCYDYTTSSDLHWVTIHLQRTLLFCASFVEVWYRACSQPVDRLVENRLRTGWDSVICPLCWLLTHSLTARVKNFRLLKFFSRSLISSNTIHVAFPMSLIYLKTQLHILFLKFTLSCLYKG